MWPPLTCGAYFLPPFPVMGVYLHAHTHTYTLYISTRSGVALCVWFMCDLKQCIQLVCIYTHTHTPIYIFYLGGCMCVWFILQHLLKESAQPERWVCVPHTCPPTIPTTIWVTFSGMSYMGLRSVMVVSQNSGSTLNIFRCRLDLSP